VKLNILTNLHFQHIVDLNLIACEGKPPYQCSINCTFMENEVRTNMQVVTCKMK